MLSGESLAEAASHAEALRAEHGLTLEEPGGPSRQVLVPAGTAYRRHVGVEHNVINGGIAPLSFVEVEIK